MTTEKFVKAAPIRTTINTLTSFEVSVLARLPLVTEAERGEILAAIKPVVDRLEKEFSEL